ncbi:MAG: YceI family protein [Bacteroidota bacterium]
MSTWKIDNMHSAVGFKVRHMMISNVSGNFTSFDATLNASSVKVALLIFRGIGPFFIVVRPA